MAIRDVSTIHEDYNQIGIISTQQTISTTYTDVQNMSFQLSAGTYQISGCIFSDDTYDSDIKWVYDGTIDQIGWGILGGKFSNSSVEVLDHRLFDFEMNSLKGFIKVTTSGTLKLQMKRHVTEINDIVLNQNSFVSVMKID